MPKLWTVFKILIAEIFIKFSYCICYFSVNGYLWVYIDENYDVVFDFTPTRSRAGTIKFLGTYCGYVQADAYSGYDEFFRKSDATEVGCHAHARRKFDYSLDTDPVRAARLLVLWGRLYDIEHKARGENYSSAQQDGQYVSFGGGIVLGTETKY